MAEVGIQNVPDLYNCKLFLFLFLVKMTKAPMMTFSLPEEEQLIDVISRKTLVLRGAEDVLCMSVKSDPDYHPMVERIKKAIDNGKH